MIKKFKGINRKYTVGIVEVIFFLIVGFIASFFVGYNFQNKEKAKDIKKDEHIERFEQNYNYIVDNYYKK